MCWGLQSPFLFLIIFILSVFDGPGDLLMPTVASQNQATLAGMPTTSGTQQLTKGLGSDLDSSLANLVGSTFSKFLNK